jgi:dihydrofolate synthase/folylpolyglutamate synthase
MQINTYDQALDYIFHTIPSQEVLKFPGATGLERMQTFLAHLGNPDKKYKIVHIAGTSGKGSTSYFTYQALLSQGLSVGLHVSPHLLDIRERLQANNNLASKREFVTTLKEMLPAIKKTNRQFETGLTYFEVMLGMALQYFASLNVDYAVVETGMGGTYDASNAMYSKDKLCIITKLGYDHTRILGTDIASIASHKAGIIHEGNTVICTDQQVKALSVVQRRVKDKRGKLLLLGEDFSIANKKLASNLSADKTPRNYFDYSSEDLTLKNISLSALGDFQIENCSLAVTAIRELSRQHHFALDGDQLRAFLRDAQFKGRFEVRHNQLNDNFVVIDGAHNSQKVAMLVRSLKRLFPGEKHHFVLAVKSGKDIEDLLKQITTVADSIALTSFLRGDQDLKRLSYEPRELVEILDKLGFTQYEIVPDPKKAVERAVTQQKRNIVITGSLYLLAEIYTQLEQMISKATD